MFTHQRSEHWRPVYLEVFLTRIASIWEFLMLVSDHVFRSLGILHLQLEFWKAALWKSHFWLLEFSEFQLPKSWDYTRASSIASTNLLEPCLVSNESKDCHIYFYSSTLNNEWLVYPHVIHPMNEKSFRPPHNSILIIHVSTIFYNTS